MSAAERPDLPSGGGPVPQGVKRRGVWVARYPDNSGCSVFATEIDALRHAVGTGMEVVHVPYGQDALSYRPKP